MPTATVTSEDRLNSITEVTHEKTESVMRAHQKVTNNFASAKNNNNTFVFMNNALANDSKCSKETAELHNTSYMSEMTAAHNSPGFNMRSSFPPKRRVVTISKNNPRTETIATPIDDSPQYQESSFSIAGNAH